MRVSYGEVTGIKGSFSVDSAILVDDMDMYNYVKRGFESLFAGEYRGLPGFAFSMGRQMDLDFVLGVIPPYPQAVVEAISELYVFGVRNVVLLSRGYRISKKVDASTTLVVQASIPLDSFTRRMVPEGLPLLASQRLVSTIKTLYDTRFTGFKHAIGTSVTLDSPRSPGSYSEVEEYIGLRGVYGVDSVSSALYALQYRYSNLDALAILTMARTLSPTHSTLESSVEEHAKLKAKEEEILSKLYIIAIELLKTMSE